MAKTLGKSVAEFSGTALLVCVVVGSGIMGTNLSTDAGIALLINTISTIFALVLLIFVLAPVSGAHFNPVVSLVELFNKNLKPFEAISYLFAQVTGAIFGSMLANLMFDLEVLQISTKLRNSTGMLVGEMIATAGLITVIGVLSKRNQGTLIPVAVATWIGSAYFFTSSTSFANPAVTVGRTFSDTFAGIAPISVLPFIAAQLVGAVVGLVIVRVVTKAQTV
jgi:glycerol uptake facilitator-like aquaporin